MVPLPIQCSFSSSKKLMSQRTALPNPLKFSPILFLLHLLCNSMLPAIPKPNRTGAPERCVSCQKVQKDYVLQCLLAKTSPKPTVGFQLFLDLFCEDQAYHSLEGIHCGFSDFWLKHHQNLGLELFLRSIL